MANGQRFDPQQRTVATPEKFFDLGTRLLITNPGSGKRVIVEVTDRMPPKQRWKDPQKSRYTPPTQRIDLTPQSAKLLGMPLSQGTVCVEVHPLKG